MSFKRLTMFIACLVLGLGWAVTTQAAKFSLTGGGGTFHIGNGLPIPIQQAVPNNPTTPTALPPLLIPVKGTPTITGTLTKPLLTAMATPAGPITKQGYQRKLVIPHTVLSKTAAQTTVGLKFSNPLLFAVGTNINFKWPAVQATFSTGNAVATTTVAGLGGTMVYSNTLGQRFGGPASFALANGPPAGNFPTAPATIYLKINTTTPACTHTAPFFGGPNPGCVAGVALAMVTGLAGPGGPTATTVMTPGKVITGNNVAAVKMGTSPLGTMLPGIAPPAITVPYPVLVAMAPLPTNMATSQPGPWTTGKLVITNSAAVPTETFTLSGKDARTPGGGGTIQLVSGALSARAASGPNANRGWLKLELQLIPDPLPTMSPVGFAAAAGLIVLAVGYAVRRRLSA